MSPRVDPRSELTPAQVKELFASLQAKREELVRHRSPRESEPRETESDPMDAASDATIEGETLGLAARDERLIREVEHALSKLELGTYGVSEGTEEPIGFARLRAVPWARRAVEEEERREAIARGRGQGRR